jgi:hypothetical protein
VADVSIVHPVATSYSLADARTAGAAASFRDALKQRQYHAGGLPAALSFYPLSVESYGRLGSGAMQFLNALAEAALASSATGSDVTKAAFISGALRELGMTLCFGNELVYRRLCMSMLLREALVHAWACMCRLLMSCRNLSVCHAFSQRLRCYHAYCYSSTSLRNENTVIQTSLIRILSWRCQIDTE